MSSVLPPFVIQFLGRVGCHGAMSLFAAVHLTLWTVLLDLHRQGAALREKSRYINRHSPPHDQAMRGDLAA